MRSRLVSHDRPLVSRGQTFERGGGAYGEEEPVTSGHARPRGPCDKLACSDSTIPAKRNYPLVHLSRIRCSFCTPPSSAL